MSGKNLDAFLRSAHLDRDRDKFSCALAVAHDELRELLHELGQAIAEVHERARIARLVDLPGRCRVRACAVREEHDGVVGGHVPVDADRVERALHGVVQRRLQRRGRDGRIRRDAPEERRVRQSLGRLGCGGADHVGVYHARALVDARDAVRPSIAERDRARAQLRERVGRHEGPRGRVPRCEAAAERVGVVARARRGERAVRAQRGEDFGDRERLADHAR